MADENLAHANTMMSLFINYIPTRMIYVAAKLGLADHIPGDGASAKDLAPKLNVHADALYRVLRTLSDLECCTRMRTTAVKELSQS